MKHNKRWYDNRIKEAEKRLVEVQSRMEQIDPATAAPEAYDELYREEWQIKEEISSLKFQCATRSWDACDWAHYELVANNID